MHHTTGTRILLQPPQPFILCCAWIGFCPYFQATIYNYFLCDRGLWGLITFPVIPGGSHNNQKTPGAASPATLSALNFPGGEQHSELLHADTECKNSLHILLTSHYKPTNVPQLLERTGSPPSSTPLSVFPVTPACHPDHQDPPWTVSSQHFSFSPAGTCCLFLPPYATSHPSACFLHFLLICCFSLLFHPPFRPSHWSLPELTALHLYPLSTPLLSTIPLPATPASVLSLLLGISGSTSRFPFPRTALSRAPQKHTSRMVSQTPLIFSWPLDLFFTDNLIFTH